MMVLKPRVVFVLNLNRGDEDASPNVVVPSLGHIVPIRQDTVVVVSCRFDNDGSESHRILNPHAYIVILCVDGLLQVSSSVRVVIELN